MTASTTDERERAIEKIRPWMVPDEDGGHIYKQRISRMMAERLYDDAVAPLLAEAWDDGHDCCEDFRHHANPYRSNP